MCEHVFPEIRLLAKRYSEIFNVGIVQCSEEDALCKAQRLQAFPEIRLFLPKADPDQNPGFVDYEGDDRQRLRI